MTKEKLLELLDRQDLNDPEADHVSAEVWLLEYVGDPEIAEAWREAAKHWWYA